MTDAKVVFLTGLPDAIVDVVTSYSPAGFTTKVVDGRQPEAEQIEAVSDADFIMVYRAELSDNVLQAAPKARMVQLLSAGYDTMNLTLMRELEIPCANNGGANSWAVADHAVLLMLSLYKRLVQSDMATRDRRWSEPIDGTNTFEMADKLVGVLGIGNIGRRVARRVQGFDAKAQYYDKYGLSPERERELDVRGVTIEELFSTSDIVTCHTPLTPETHRIVSAEMLALMKPTAILINTSRGPVVHEAALIDALQHKKIAGAGLDVFEKEPVEPDNPLLTMDNVVVTPHSAGTTWNTWFRRAEFAYRNMKGVWEGQPPQAIAADYEG